MILTDNIPIGRILKGTWKNFLFSVVTCIVAYFINEFWLKNYFSFPVFVPTILGTALAFFIGFNNNQAYDRWWEARKIWGSLVNNSRTWGRLLIAHTTPSSRLDEPELTSRRTQMIKRHIAFLYLLKTYLRNKKSNTYKKYLAEDEVAGIAAQTNQHNAVLTLQSKDLERLYQQGAVDGFRFLELSKILTSFCDDMGKAERIRNTVFPTTYIYYSRSFIWIFVYSITMTISNSIGISSIVFGTLLGYIFFTIQAIGQTLINPFENIVTGVPLSQITRTIEINLLEMLGEDDIPQPQQSVKGEYIM